MSLDNGVNRKPAVYKTTGSRDITSVVPRCSE